MKIDPSKPNTDPVYLRRLIERAGLNQVTAAKAIGIDARTMRRYVSLDPKVRRDAPYPIQCLLENLPKAGKRA